MQKNKWNARIVGILFIVATAAGIISLGPMAMLDETDYLARITADSSTLIQGVMLVTVMGMACAGIAVAMYPAILPHAPGLALGSVVFRGLEGGIFLVSAASLLVLPVCAAMPDTELAYALGDAFKEFQHVVGSTGATLSFCLGAFLYYIVLFRSKLIPRWLSAWGLVAILMHVVASVWVIFGQEAFSTPTIILNVPIALQEMVMAVWLIVKGFNADVIVPSRV